jgi:hypothetical protein
MTFTTVETPWVTVKKNDPSFKLQGPLTVSDRAYIQINKECPTNMVLLLQNAIQNGWVEAVASVPKDDPTLFWDTLKS